MRRFLAAAPALRRLSLAAYTGGAIGLGYAARGFDDEQKGRSLPSGWRSCCESTTLTSAQKALPGVLNEIVGEAHVSCNVEQKGSRLGKGDAYVVVRPSTIQQALDCLQACVDADACVIPQGANTGLTGGSVPRAAGEPGLDRPTVVINMTRMDRIVPIDGGKRLVCLAGAGIYSAKLKAAEVVVCLGAAPRPASLDAPSHASQPLTSPPARPPPPPHLRPLPSP